MGYQIKKYEWDLTEEEQEQAKFIRDYCEQSTKGTQITARLNGSAFEDFKLKFYTSVWSRLLIKTANYWSLGPSEWDAFGKGCFGLNDDCSKIIAYRVDKIQE